MMLSKHLTNVVQNLEKRKFRDKYNLFKVEGEKMVEELFRSGWQVETLIARDEWLQQHAGSLPDADVVEVDEREMKAVSHFTTPPAVIALARVPAPPVPPADWRQRLSLALNGIQDPGNFGTILRLCDWFGVRDVFCDADCAGLFNPKVVQASMGAIFRVRVHYTDLPALLAREASPALPCYGTFLRGEDLYGTPLSPRGIILMGNEGRGISPSIAPLVTRRLTIPRFVEGEASSESLNVSVATAIVLAEFKRQTCYH